jgi:hypothetical protein
MQENLNKTAFTKAFSEKGIDDNTRINMLLQEGVNPEHPVLKALIDRSSRQPKTQVVGRGGSLVDANGKVLYQNEMTYAPRGGGGAGPGSGDPAALKPEKPGALSQVEKWAKTYETGARIIDEQIMDEYRAKLATYQSDPEGTDGIAANKWLTANQTRAGSASERLNQYWKASSGGAYRREGEEGPEQPPAAQPTAAAPPSNESREDRERRLKAVLGL